MWEPRTEIATDTVTASAAAALHGLLDAPGQPPADGAPLPALWHWLAFLPRTPQQELGPDGHPHRGTFLPPVELPRRMFAGGRFTFAGDVRIGDPLTRRSEVVSVEEKEGRSGPLVFVTVRHEIGVAIVEEQDIVYRGASTGPASAPGVAAEPDEAEAWPWSWDLAVDPTLLFRFSALSYNAHRIHYDRTYATEVEGYPGLVVHGPLQAVALAELCRRQRPDRPLASFSFRALRPSFDDAPLKLRGQEDAGAVTLAALGSGGHRTMEAAAAFAG